MDMWKASPSALVRFGFHGQVRLGTVGQCCSRMSSFVVTYCGSLRLLPAAGKSGKCGSCLCNCVDRMKRFVA